MWGLCIRMPPWCNHHGTPIAIFRSKKLRDQHLRKRLILSIISSEKVHNQCELREKLKAAGIEVTQATLSRDLKFLGVVRVFDPERGYVYTVSQSGQSSDLDLREELIRGIKDIKFSGNLAIIKTKLGHATGVAYEIDQLKIPDILGTIGGDDTLLVVFKENGDHDSFLKALRG
jgi:transcriptional regulator of arginine metabolism